LLRAAQSFGNLFEQRVRAAAADQRPLGARGSIVEFKMPRLLAGAAAIVLLATAAFHATGYRSIMDGVQASSLSPFFRRVLPGIWLFFSWHLVALALGLGWASIRGSSSARSLVWFIAVLVCADTFFVVSLAGFFAGTALLSAAAISLVIAAVRWPGA
jgi:hypothetical protein